MTLVEVQVVNAIQKRSMLERRGTYPSNVQRLGFRCALPISRSFLSLQKFCVAWYKRYR